MTVAPVLYAYARGTRFSRAIERACIEDIAFRVIAAQHKPDHATSRTILDLSRLITRLDEEGNYDGTEPLMCPRL